MIRVTQRLQDLDLDLALLMQFLPVLQDLHCHCLAQLMVEAAYHHAESTLSQFLLHFVTIVYLLFRLIEVVSLVVVEAMVVDGVRIGIWLRVLVLTVDFTANELAYPFVLCV